MPEYDRLSVALGTTLAACFTVLPAGPTYLDPSKKLLPAPPWRTLVFYFSGLTSFPTGAVWLPFFHDCGDIEINPGPDQGAAFHTFATSLADVFIPACDHLVMARALTSLHGTMTSAGLTVKDVASLLAIPGDSADDCLRLAAAFGLYANLSLTFPDGIPTWSSLSKPEPHTDSQIDLLLQKIKDLELRLDVPQVPPVDPYTFGVGEDNDFHVLIPWAQIQDLLDANGPSRFFPITANVVTNQPQVTSL